MHLPSKPLIILNLQPESVTWVLLRQQNCQQFNSLLLLGFFGKGVTIWIFHSRHHNVLQTTAHFPMLDVDITLAKKMAQVWNTSLAKVVTKEDTYFYKHDCFIGTR